MDLIITATVPAEQVRVGEYVLGIGNARLVVDEVRHRTRRLEDEGGQVTAVTLLCWPAEGEHPAKRTVLEYDDGTVQCAAVVPAGKAAAAVGAALGDAFTRARDAWLADERESDEAPGPLAAPWDVDQGTGVATVRAAGRTWALSLWA